MNKSIDAFITADTVKGFGENIALHTLKQLMAYRYKEIAPLYYGLIRDIHSEGDIKHTISEGYDVAQTAICFLCEYMGRKLVDMVIGKYGKPVTIIHACISEVGNYIHRRRKYRENTYPLLATDMAKTAEPFEENTIEESHEKVEKTIRAMHLTNRQKLTLDCYMKGMGVMEISRLLNVATCTVWRNRMQLQRKYNEL